MLVNINPHPVTGQVHHLASGRFDATVNLRALLMWAYAVDGELIEGAFPILDEGFVIAAKAPGPVLLAQPGDVGPMNLMLQSDSTMQSG